MPRTLKTLLSASICASLIFNIPMLARAEGTDLLPPPESPLVDTKKIDEEILSRRTDLKWHQGLGIATLVLLTATTVVGQLNYNDVISGAGTQKYQTAHKSLAIGSTLTFTGAGIMALVAPTPFPKKAQFDTTTLHKITMTLTALAMAGQIGLGVWSRNSRGTVNEEPRASAHLALGYATYGLSILGASFHLF